MNQEQGPLLEMDGISKHYGSETALDEVTLALKPGEVLGLVGDNGAGKSTLIKILSGAITADEGQVFLEGKEVKVENPQDARNLGIETIYQTFALVGNLPIYLNIFLGRYRVKKILGGLIKILDEKRMEKESWEILQNLKIHFNSVKEKVDHLSGGQRQAVAIGRALFFNPRIIIMDEPTSGLAVKEVEQIHDIIRDFKTKGVSIIFITHRLQSIFAVADRVMVLRGGRNAMDKRIPETTLEEVVRAMFGLNVKVT
ncbi:MAG: ATP-binding cassette domain-containing protein [Desulfobacterales bacterium]|nr:ATP-binding cassette domain-containing protein [Desulfobacterales bacterium]